MKIGIVIPWRPQPYRVKAFEFTYNWYKTNFPDSKIYLADKPGEFWSMGGSRNLGVKMAEADNCDLIIVSDADTVPEMTTLNATIAAAMNDRCIHLPYTNALYYDKESSDKIVNGEPLENMKFTEHDSLGGIYVFQPISWWTIGGADEKFLGWGYEDNAMDYVHGILHSQGMVKHLGRIHSLYHERAEGIENPSPNVYNNFLLYRRYIEITSPIKLLELVKAKVWN
jgi:hypothetical protein